jgi:hypothetical protein
VDLAGVGGQLGGEPFRAHGGAVDFHERPQHRPAVTGHRAVPVVGEDGLAVADRVVDLGHPVQWPAHIAAAARVLEDREPGLGHGERVADLEAYGGRIGCRPRGPAPAQALIEPLVAAWKQERVARSATGGSDRVRVLGATRQAGGR